MDPVRPGVFKAFGRGMTKEKRGLGESALHRPLDPSYVAEFQVVVDEDFDRAYYPEISGATSGECIVRGPDANSKGRSFYVRTPCMPSAAFEVCLDLTSMDKRKTITWTLVVNEHEAPFR